MEIAWETVGCWAEKGRKQICPVYNKSPKRWINAKRGVEFQTSHGSRIALFDMPNSNQWNVPNNI